MCSLFEKIMEKPKKRIKTFLGRGRLESPKPIQEDIFKLLIFEYPARTRLQMGLVVPFAKEITDNCISKLEADIKEIDTPSGRGKDNLNKELIDRLLREKHFWIEDFYSTYQNEHDKNKRCYVSQWTTEEKSGKICTRGFKQDPELASEIQIGKSALTWLTSLAFC